MPKAAEALGFFLGEKMDPAYEGAGADILGDPLPEHPVIVDLCGCVRSWRLLRPRSLGNAVRRENIDMHPEQVLRVELNCS